ncbi:YcnI family protein [Microbacterium halotolerans]|uniref:YcnI family copper-binding membrane protein n=1 Tax=Microbacterium halotolerans TaxID=246613 RepID=UPI0013C2F411|nr:YcnI family protein [Microbacterium halotolerans]
MSANRTKKKLTMGAAGIAVVTGMVLAPAAASAHIAVEPDGAPVAGTTRNLAFAIGHGCDGSPTTSIEIELPAEGISGVKPVVQAGWDIEIANDGDAGRPSAVTFTPDEPVSDEMRAEVVLNVGLLSDASGTIAFPVEQTCEEGSLAWDEIAEDGQDPHDLELPAPVLEIEAADEAADGGMSGHGDPAESGDEGAAEASDASEVEPSVLPTVLGGAGLGAGVVALAVSIVALRRKKA